MVNVDWNIVVDVRDWILDPDPPSSTNFSNGTFRAPLADSPFGESTFDGRAVKGYLVVEFEPNLPPDQANVKSVFISKLTEVSPGEGQFVPFSGWTGEPVIAFRALESKGYVFSDFLDSLLSGAISIEDLVSGHDKHNGNIFRNFIAPGDGDDTVTAGQGADTVGYTEKRAGFDLGNDLIYGNEGNDYLVGGYGNDIIYGNQGLDLIAGGTGADTLFGGQNGGEPTEDVRGNLRMQDGTESIFGGSGNDLIYGNFGNETIYGGSLTNDTIYEDDDTIFGGQGDDTISGGPGGDQLWGQRGNDVLVGGSGPDRFFLNGGGIDRIRDFAPGDGDRIGVFGDFTEIAPRAGSGDAILDWSRGQSTGTVVLEGTDPEDFSEDWLFIG